MDNPVLKTSLAVVAGVIAGGAIVFVTEAIGHSLFPPPADIDLSNPDDVKRLMASLPAGAFAMVLLGWFLGGFSPGPTSAHAIARKPVAAWAVAVIFILFTIMNFFMIPHPAWIDRRGVADPAGERVAGAADCGEDQRTKRSAAEHPLAYAHRSTRVSRPSGPRRFSPGTP